MLQNVGTPQPPSVLNLHLAFANKGEGGPNPCDTNVNFVGTIVNGEGPGILSYAFQLIKEPSATVTSRYIPF